MKHHLFVPSGFLFAAVLFCGAANRTTAAEAETYVLARKNFVSPAGTSMTKEFTMDLKDATMTITAGGNKIPGSMTRQDMTKESLEVISPMKLRLVITDKKVESKMTMNGQDQPAPDDSEPLLNKPIIFDLKDGKWAATLEDGAEPTAKQRKTLEKKTTTANNDADFEMYGNTPRKVGDEWKVDPSKVGFSEGSDLKGDYSVKLVDVKDIQGVKCAVLKATYDFTGKTETQVGSPELSMRMKGEAISTRSISDMQDLDVQINATMTLEGSPAEGISMHIEGPMKGTQKITLKKP